MEQEKLLEPVCLLIIQRTNCQAVVSALMDHSKPELIHSDHGSEYTAKYFKISVYLRELKYPCPEKVHRGKMDIRKVSMTNLKLILEIQTDLMTWENWYMKSITRSMSTIPPEIHTVLKMSPREFAKKKSPQVKLKLIS